MSACSSRSCAAFSTVTSMCAPVMASLTSPLCEPCLAFFIAGALSGLYCTKMNFGRLHSTPPRLSTPQHRKPPQPMEVPSCSLKTLSPPSPLLVSSSPLPSVEYSQKTQASGSVSSITWAHAFLISSSTLMDRILSVPLRLFPAKCWTLGPKPGAFRPMPPPLPAPPTAMLELLMRPQFLALEAAASLLSRDLPTPSGTLRLLRSIVRALPTLSWPSRRGRPRMAPASFCQVA
mmetsp:Transcript_131294/g.365967  ORF Transcript_131294/g.365967 Transcript_131294/m.365967 type:complete len:233 (+) Transcript_131294:313-1011(+)